MPLIPYDIDDDSIPKIASGVTGLDPVLRGGLPKGRVTQVGGGPGSGKTVFGLQFLIQGVLENEPGLMVVFEEDAERIRRNARSLGWKLGELEQQKKLFLLDAVPAPEVAISGGFDITGLIALLQGQSKAMNAQRLVIDAVDGLLRLFPSQREERDQMQRLFAWLSTCGLSVVLTSKTSEGDATPFDYLDFLSDCVIRLDQRVRGQITTRRLRVVKYRGSSFGANEYPYSIGKNGIRLIPITTLALNPAPLGEHISTGSKPLDDLLEGGFRRGSCIIVTGISGTGKTTLACTFVTEAARRGEKTLFIDFEESEAALISTMLSPGIDLRPALEEGNLRTLVSMPEAMGVEEHLVRALNLIEDYGPQIVVVDAISGTRRMGDDLAAFEYLARLMNFCKERSITVLLTNQALSNEFEADVTGVGFSSLVDVILLLQYARVDSEMKRTLLVWKARGSGHSRRFHDYEITAQGIKISPGRAALSRPESRSDLPLEQGGSLR